MIPRRISLSGFLSYREEQVIDFSGASLWMLAGQNGSGKSAVFDGLTYVLFGHHRGGARDAIELINKECDGFLVEFDFLLDDKLYRAKRTLKKSKRGSVTTTQSIVRVENGQPSAIPDTNRKSEYDAWIREHVGLSYDTFTSSVLLLQGRAERLLDATAKGRFEVLAGIVDLERYVRLHTLADERRRIARAKCETLQSQFAGITPVTADELVAADGIVAEAEFRRVELQSELQRWQLHELAAKRWAELHNKSQDIAQRMQHAQSLLAESANLKRCAQRCRELATVLPHAETIIKHRGQIAESQRRTVNLESQQAAARQRFEAADQAIQQATRKRTALQKSITEDELNLTKVAEQIQECIPVLGKLASLEAHRLERQRVEREIAKVPSNIEQQVELRQKEVEELSQLAIAVPQLARLIQLRDELCKAREKQQNATKSEQGIKAAGEQLSSQIKELAPDIEKQGQDRIRADEAASAANALLKRACDEETAFCKLDGEKLCTQCGQELTPAHFANELAKRRQVALEARVKADAAVALRQSLRDSESVLQKRLVDLERQRDAKRDEYREIRQQVEQAARDCERCIGELASIYEELPEPFRSSVASEEPSDWLSISFPNQRDLDEARLRLESAERIKEQLSELRRQRDRLIALQGQAKTIDNNIAVLIAEIPSEPEQIRRRHARAESEHAALTGTVRASRAECETVQRQLEVLGKERHGTETEVVAIDERLKGEESARALCGQALDSATIALPEEWRTLMERAALAELHGWKSERESLVAQDVEKKAEELQSARADLHLLEQSRIECDRELNAIPEDARQPIAEVQARLQLAQERARQGEEAERAARQARFELQDRQRRREELQLGSLNADRERDRYAVLAQCLGRDRLQLHLVRQAERQIVDHANAVLDRISGGQLFLRLRAGEEGQESEHALELEACNRVTGGKPINVSFLSGSQRFRVAVSLALGIGQYASRQHRPIESVIIDEGFGCLDRNGRQVMIQELHNLRDQLKCVLLVSHQEEFADAFNDGYRFELIDGTTQVTRIQR